MKNFFTSVRLPKGRASGELGECIKALGELVSQLRITINSIDIDNMSEGLKRRLDKTPRIFEFSENEEIDCREMKNGDLILIYSEAHGSIFRVVDAYIYRNGGLE